MMRDGLRLSKMGRKPISERCMFSQIGVLDSEPDKICYLAHIRFECDGVSGKIRCPLWRKVELR